MDTLAIIKRIELRLAELRMSKADFYKLSGISSASYSQWNTGKYNPSESKLRNAAECLGVSVGYLLGEEPKEKTPTLTQKDERDIARNLEKIMADLENSGDLMFDGDPMSDEARDSIRSALKLGLEAAKLKNKETYTPKKYRKD